MPRLLVNPAAGGGRVARVLRDAADRVGLEWIEPASTAAVADCARQAAEDGEERLLVAGGDGTLHHAIRGLAGTDCALAVLPFGTGNDLARALGLRPASDPHVAIVRGLRDPIRRIDLGRIGRTPFLGVASGGLVGNVLEWIERRGPKRVGPAVYAWAVARTLFGFQPPRVVVEHDEGRFEGAITLVGVANSPFFGGGMRVAPAARLDDGRLDLIVVEAMSRFAILRAFPRIYRGTHTTLPSVRTARLCRASIEADPPLEIFGDGEPMGRTGVEVEIAPGALAVVAPPG